MHIYTSVSYFISTFMSYINIFYYVSWCEIIKKENTVASEVCDFKGVTKNTVWKKNIWNDNYKKIKRIYTEF